MSGYDKRLNHINLSTEPVGLAVPLRFLDAYKFTNLYFFDLDDVEQPNNTKGHDAGDAALQATNNALLDTLRFTDLVARLRGEEFALLLREIGHEDAAEKVL